MQTSNILLNVFQLEFCKTLHNCTILIKHFEIFNESKKIYAK
jgi:hypothetical protein